MAGVEPGPFSSLEDAVAALAGAEAGRHVKAAREIREEIVRRWPDSAAARDAAALLGRNRAAVEDRARSDSHRREAAERRARSERFGERAAQEARAVDEARQEVPALTVAAEARRRAKAEQASGRHFVAREWARRAVDLDDTFASRTALAATLRHCGMVEEALEQYRIAWRMPDVAEHVVRTGAAAVLADSGRTAEAWELLKPVFAQHADDAFALHLAGRIHRLLGDLPAAERFLGKAAGLTVTRAAASRELRMLLEQARAVGDTDVVTSVERRLGR